MPSEDGQILPDVRESSDDCGRLLQEFRLSCRRQEICFAGIAGRAYGNLMLTLEQQAAFVEEAPEIFLSIPGDWGKMGYTHICLAAGEDGLTGALRTAWKLRIDKNAKTSRKIHHVAERWGVTDKKLGKRSL